MVIGNKMIDQPFKPSRCIKASLYIPENRLNFPTIKGFRTKIPMQLVYQYMVIFFNYKPHQIIFIHYKLRMAQPLQVENCDSNSRLVVDEDDKGKFRLERVKHQDFQMFALKYEQLLVGDF